MPAIGTIGEIGNTGSISQEVKDKLRGTFLRHMPDAGEAIQKVYDPEVWAAVWVRLNSRSETAKWKSERGARR